MQYEKLTASARKYATSGVQLSPSQRLDLLEQHGLINRTVHSSIPPRTSYELTEAGMALRPIIEAIVSWGENYMSEE